MQVVGNAILFLLSASLFASALPRAQDPRALTASEIVKKSVVANTADWKAQPGYSYREHDSKSKIDSSGQVTIQQSKTYDVAMIEGSPYSRLVALNDEPLGGVQQQQEQGKLSREVQRRQNESHRERQARTAKYQNERAEEHLLMQQMVDAFTFSLGSEQSVEGVNCYVLDAVPNPDYRPPLEKAKVLTHMKGRLWIEKTQFHWAKVEAQVTNAVEFGLFIAKVKPGTMFELDQAPVADVWLPKRFTQTINASVFGIYGMRSKEQEDYSDYRQTIVDAQRRTLRK